MKTGEQIRAEMLENQKKQIKRDCLPTIINEKEKLNILEKAFPPKNYLITLGDELAEELDLLNTKYGSVDICQGICQLMRFYIDRL